jgi:quercetin dioxygenase-like cupin family protein
MSVMGGLYSYRATPDETGAYLACEVAAPSGFAIPAHFHEDEDEAFYVARGAVTIFVNGREQTLDAGGFAFAPRGAHHTFRFEAPDSALLLLITPGHRHEEMFRAMSLPGEIDPAALAAAAAQYGTFIVGPPPVR